MAISTIPDPALQATLYDAELVGLGFILAVVCGLAWWGIAAWRHKPAAHRAPRPTVAAPTLVAAHVPRHAAPVLAAIPALAPAPVIASAPAPVIEPEPVGFHPSYMGGLHARTETLCRVSAVGTFAARPVAETAL